MCRVGATNGIACHVEIANGNLTRRMYRMAGLFAVKFEMDGHDSWNVLWVDIMVNSRVDRVPGHLCAGISRKNIVSGID